MDFIVKESGVSKATIYAHFKNKAELFRSVIAGYALKYDLKSPQQIFINSSAKNHEELSAFLLKFLKITFNYFNNDAVVKLYQLLIAEVINFPEIFEIVFGPAKTQLTTELCNYLTQYAESINTKIDACFILSCQILDLIRGASLWPKLGQNPQKKILLKNKEQTIKYLHKSIMILINAYMI